MSPRLRPAGRRYVAAILKRLLSAHGWQESIIFGTQQEGRMLRDGATGRPVESLSGFAVDREGRVARFWLAQENDGQELRLEPFEILTDTSVFRTDPEYLAALGKVRAKPAHEEDKG